VDDVEAAGAKREVARLDVHDHLVSHRGAPDERDIADRRAARGARVPAELDDQPLLGAARRRMAVAAGVPGVRAVGLDDDRVA
jgi:hypothetical protein